MPRLIGSIHADRVVCRRFPEMAFPRLIAVIGVEAGIDEDRLAAQKCHDCQRVRVPMCRARHLVVPQPAGLFAAVEANVVGRASALVLRTT